MQDLDFSGLHRAEENVKIKPRLFHTKRLDESLVVVDAFVNVFCYCTAYCIICISIIQPKLSRTSATSFPIVMSFFIDLFV